MMIRTAISDVLYRRCVQRLKLNGPPTPTLRAPLFAAQCFRILIPRPVQVGSARRNQYMVHNSIHPLRTQLQPDLEQLLGDVGLFFL